MKTCPFFARLACVLWFGAVPMARAEFYTFTTIAGLAGQSGSVDGTNSDARFNYPCEIAIDGAGVIYVTDLLNHTIRKMVTVGTNWAVTTIAGMAGVSGSDNGTNTDARFNHPNGIVADQAGNLFVVDHYNDTIRKLTQSGTNWIVTTVAGLAGVRGTNDGSNSDARFWAPVGIAVDKNDDLFVADASNFTIRGIKPVGTNWVVSTLAGTALIYGFADGTNEAAEFDYPYNIALSGAGVLYVTDFGNNSIRQIAPVGPDWVTRTIAGFSGSVGTNDGPGGIASFNSPNGIAVDGATNLYVADQFNHTIRKVAPGGSGWMVSTLAGAAGQRGTNDGIGDKARFNKPWGIAVDGMGNLFVVDYLNHTIRRGVPPPIPTLQIFRSANQVVLAWPAAATNYVLESAGNLRPGAVWAPVTNAIVTSGENRFLTNYPGAAPAFFRLHKQ